jgi:hypothetical protein
MIEVQDPRSAALEKAFFELLPSAVAPGDLTPYHCDLISGIARELLLMIPVERPKTLPAKRALLDLARLARGTVETVDHLPQVAVDSLYAQIPMLPLSTLRAMLAGLARAAEDAAVEIQVAEGRPRQTWPSQADKVRKAVGQHFEALTGEKGNTQQSAFRYATRSSLQDPLYPSQGPVACPRGQITGAPRQLVDPKQLAKQSQF